MTDRIFEQIMAIRELPDCPNMFDTTVVQEIALDNEFFELALFIEQRKHDYCNFILYGKREE